MKILQQLIIFLILLCSVVAIDDHPFFSKTVLLKQGQSATLRINGTNSINNIWSVQRVTISATTRDYSYSIDSPDSSLFRFLLNCVNSIFNTKLLNYHFFYDTISMPSPVSYVFLSPFGQSSITLKNNLLNPDYILRIKVEFSKEFSLLYPLLLLISIILFGYSKKLYYSKLFYYIAAGLFAPIIVLIYVSFSAITYVIKSNGLQVFLKVLLLSIVTKCVISHSFYIWIQYYFNLYSLVFVVIYSSCAAVCIFYIYSHISFYTKSEVRLIYALLKLIPICLLFQTSSSISISLLIVTTILIIGFISGYLKWNNIKKECSIVYHCLCYDHINSEIDTILSQELSESTFNQVRSILLEYKHYLQTYCLPIRQQLTEYDQKEFDQFTSSPQLIFPDYKTLQLYREKINSHHMSLQRRMYYSNNDPDNTTMLLDETNERPLFEGNNQQYGRLDKPKESIWNRIVNAWNILFYGSIENKNQQANQGVMNGYNSSRGYENNGGGFYRNTNYGGYDYNGGYTGNYNNNNKYGGYNSNYNNNNNNNGGYTGNYTSNNNYGGYNGGYNSNNNYGGYNGNNNNGGYNGGNYTSNNTYGGYKNNFNNNGGYNNNNFTNPSTNRKPTYNTNYNGFTVRNRFETPKTNNINRALFSPDRYPPPQTNRF